MASGFRVVVLFLCSFCAAQSDSYSAAWNDSLQEGDFEWELSKAGDSCQRNRDCKDDKFCTTTSCEDGICVVEDWCDSCDRCSDSRCSKLGLRSRGGLCGASDISALGNKCSGKLTYVQARQFCERGGMRLCTRNELENNVAAGTGCGYDDKLVWSSTKCGNSKHRVVSGSTGGPSSKCRSNSGGYRVRCCADKKHDFPPCCPDCTANKECKDGDSCTENLCEEGLCVNPEVCECRNHDDCHDGDPCSKDICKEDGNCVHREQCSCDDCAIEEDWPINRVTARGTIKSYHERPEPHAYADVFFTQPSITEQIGHLGIRIFNFDIYPTEDAFKVLNSEGFDETSNCGTLIDCLQEAYDWVKMTENNGPYFFFITPGERLSDSQWEFLDALIKNVWKRKNRVIPDDLRLKSDLRASVIEDRGGFGWPLLKNARGKAFFVIDRYGNDYYSGDHKRGGGRVAFVSVGTGDRDTIFLSYNTYNENISKHVKAGYMVHVRSDVDYADAISCLDEQIIQRYMFDYINKNEDGVLSTSEIEAFFNTQREYSNELGDIISDIEEIATKSCGSLLDSQLEINFSEFLCVTAESQYFKTKTDYPNLEETLFMNQLFFDSGAQLISTKYPRSTENCRNAAFPGNDYAFYLNINAQHPETVSEVCNFLLQDECVVPDNNDCKDAVRLRMDKAKKGTIRGATLESEELPKCGPRYRYPGVWYRFVGTGEFVEVSTCSEDTTAATRITVLTGGCPSPQNCVKGGGNDRACHNPGSTVKWKSSSGVNYYILVHLDDEFRSPGVDFKIIVQDAFADSCVLLHNQCDGDGYEGPTGCCKITHECKTQRGIEQCVPSDDRAIPSPDGRQNGKKCVGSWGDCSGNGRCCDWTPVCRRIDKGYYQCEPEFEEDSNDGVLSATDTDLAIAAIVIGSISIILVMMASFFWCQQRRIASGGGRYSSVPNIQEEAAVEDAEGAPQEDTESAVAAHA